MTYLDPPRLHFAGAFFSDPSTVNNDPAHYDTATFDRSSFWEQQTATAANGWWNPDGRHAFRFENVTVRSAVGPGGEPVTGDVVGLRFVTRGLAPAKMVDLDTDQQLTSMIYGLTVALVDAAGAVLLEAAMEPAPFTDIWRRGSTGAGDEAACAAYQSTLDVVRWGELSASPFLQQLRAAVGDGLLSIKFNVDGYSMRSTGPGGTPNPGFARGRVAGTVGAAAAGEPRHTVVGRQFGTEVFPPGSVFPGFRPAGGVNYFHGVVDAAAGTLRLDLGNALPAATAGGPPQDIGELVVVCRDDGGQDTDVGPLGYRATGWYEATAGVADLPLDGVGVERVAAGRLRLVARIGGQQRTLVEEADVHVRADAFVHRLDPGDQWVVRLHVTRRGRPLTGARVDLALLLPAGPDAQQGFPVDGLTFPGSVTTDSGGTAEATLEAADPGDTRFFYSGERREHVDGQIYRVAYQVDGTDQPNPSNVLSVLVWTTFRPDDPPTWHGSMRDVLTQYGNLYPWMTRFGPHLDLALYEQVAAQREDIVAVLERPDTDSRYMPVSRDLSGTRRAAMLTWLTTLGQDAKPLLGTPSTPAPPAPPAGPTPPPAARQPVPAALLGGKSAAGERLDIAPLDRATSAAAPAPGPA